MRTLMLFVVVSLLSSTLSSCASPRFASGGRSSGGSASGVRMVEEGIASYYAHDYHGRKTANGEVFDMNKLTAAHRTLPFNTKIRVRNLDNGKVVVVRINDRGPFKDNRVIDLSLAAARELDMLASGLARVRIEVLELGPTL